jgi:hypothetical protein
MILAQVHRLCSQRGMSFRRIQDTGVYNCVGAGQSSSSVVMGIAVINVVDIGFPDQISGPPKRWRYVDMSVAMLRAIMEGQSERPPRRV